MMEIDLFEKRIRVVNLIGDLKYNGRSYLLLQDAKNFQFENLLKITTNILL